MMSMELLPQQAQKNIEEVQQEQRRIRTQMQENISTFNEEWNRWTTPRRIRRQTQEMNKP